MEAGVAADQDGDVLGVLLQEAGHGHHHAGVDLPALLSLPQEDEVLAPGGRRQGRLLEGHQGRARRRELARVLPELSCYIWSSLPGTMSLGWISWGKYPKDN